jgi:hypothetical protein
MAMMSSGRIVSARIGSAGSQSVCRIALALAHATPNHRPHAVPRQIARAAKNWSTPSPRRNQPQVLRSPKTYLALCTKTFALSIAAIP